MRSAKVVSLLKLIKNNERTSLRKFIISPYYTQNEDVVALFDALMAYFPKFNSDELVIENICNVVYPNKPCDKYLINRLRKVATELTKAIEKYLVTHDFMRDKIATNLQLATVLLKRGAFESLEKVIVKIKKQMEESVTVDERYYWNQVRLLELELNHLVMTANSANKEVGELMEQLLAYHKTYCLISTLDFTRSQVSMRVLGGKYNKDGIRELLAKAQTEFDLSPGIAPYYFGLAILVVEDKEEVFSQFYELLFETASSNNYVYGTRQMIYTQLINYALGRINAGEESYYKKAFDLYKKGIKKGYVYHDKVLKPISFLNIVKVAAALNEIDWANDFIAKHKTGIPRKQRNEFVELAELFVKFHTGLHEEINKELATINPRNPRLKLTSRALHLLNRYELYVDDADYEYFMASIDGFSNLVNRQKSVSPILKEQYNNMAHYLKLMIDCRNDKTGCVLKKEALYADIKNTPNVMNKLWLLSKLKEL